MFCLYLIVVGLPDILLITFIVVGFNNFGNMLYLVYNVQSDSFIFLFICFLNGFILLL